MKEFSIMPKSKYWGVRRDEINTTRHELLSAFNREKSIKEGLVIFIPFQLHELEKHCFQYDPDIKAYMKWVAMSAWCDKNKKDEIDFFNLFHEYGVKPDKTEEEIFEPLYKNYQYVIQHNIRENKFVR